VYRFSDGAESNTPESNISGFGRAVKEQARPLFMGVFAHRSDVPFINLSTHIFESRYYNKISDVYSLRQQSRETCHQKTGSNTIMIICKKLRRKVKFSVTFYPLTSHTFHQTGKVFRLFINSKRSSFLVILG
jgi:hypothetical protein